MVETATTHTRPAPQQRNNNKYRRLYNIVIHVCLSVCLSAFSGIHFVLDMRRDVPLMLYLHVRST